MYEKDILFIGRSCQSGNVFVCSVADGLSSGLGAYPGAGSDLLADVSGNNTVTAFGNSSSAPYEETVLQNIYSSETYTVSDPDLVSGALESIDNKLTTIIFLILFIWCARHIKNSVRSFTRRRVD